MPEINYDSFHNAMSIWAFHNFREWPNDDQLRELAMQLGIDVNTTARPRMTHVKRRPDMGELHRLELLLEDDGDVIVSIGMNTIQVCVPGTGGGRSPRTHRALLFLMQAIADDNEKNPI